MKYKTGWVTALWFIAFFLKVQGQTKASTLDNRPVVLLFHGMGSKPIAFHRLKQHLEKAFPLTTVIALEAVEGKKSLKLSVKAQAKACFKEVQRKVLDLHQRNIVLIGHSQGGLRAYVFLTAFKSQLNIKGLITLAAPWEGVPGAKVNKAMLDKGLTEAVLKDVEALSFMLGYTHKEVLVKQLYLEIKKNQWMQWFPGAKDLTVNSKFLKEVARCLAKEDKPIVAIAGGGGDFLDLVANPVQKTPLPHLNALYARFVTGQPVKQIHTHDMWIPCYSQHALNVVAAQKANFTRIYFKDAFHTRKIWAIIPVPEPKQILLHPGVMETVIHFTRQFLG